MDEANEIELLFFEKQSYSHYGLPVVLIPGEGEYAVAENEAAAQAAANESARDSLWAFNSSFIARFLELNTDQAKAIEEMQRKLCEDAQPIIELLIGDRRHEFLTEAVDADGRGHFLSPYDSEEVDGEDVSPCPSLAGKLLYRIN